MYLVYKTDCHHSYASQDIIGVCTTKQKCISICKKQARKEGEIIDEDQLFNLNNISQTQNYSGEGEFQFESFRVNVLL